MDQDGSLNISFDEWRDFLLYAPTNDIHELIRYWRHSTASTFSTILFSFLIIYLSVFVPLDDAVHSYPHTNIPILKKYTVTVWIEKIIREKEMKNRLKTSGIIRFLFYFFFQSVFNNLMHRYLTFQYYFFLRITLRRKRSRLYSPTALAAYEYPAIGRGRGLGYPRLAAVMYNVTYKRATRVSRTDLDSHDQLL